MNFTSNLGEPDRPGKPVVKDYDKHSALLKWAPPADEHGAPVTSYLIEKKDQYRCVIYKYIIIINRLSK